MLDTPAKQVKWAKKLATEQLGSAIKRVENPPIQGMFSRTLFVTLKDAREFAIQFRTEELDIDAFRIAKSALGDLVPDTGRLESEQLRSEGIWAYSLTRMPGMIWQHGVTGKGADGRISVNKSLGRVFSKGYLAQNSSGFINHTVRPHLSAILASGLEEIIPYKELLQDFADRLEDLAQLPLWVAHYDLNDVNVLIDGSCNVTALIDWESSSPLPFGVGFGRIHTLAGEYTGGEFWVPEEFEEAERGVWKNLLDGVPENVRMLLEQRKRLIQDAVMLGTLLDCFFLDNGKVGFSQIALKTLPKFLTYQIPLLRVARPPYEK